MFISFEEFGTQLSRDADGLGEAQVSAPRVRRHFQLGSGEGNRKFSGARFGCRKVLDGLKWRDRKERLDSGFGRCMSERVKDIG